MGSVVDRYERHLASDAVQLISKVLGAFDGRGSVGGIENEKVRIVDAVGDIVKGRGFS